MSKRTPEQYWLHYVETLPVERGQQDYLVDQFGDNPKLANELGDLILSGAKTATCSALREYQAEQASIPIIGTLTIVLDGAENPLCIIETTDVQLCSFIEVDAQFAYEEGEGDRTLRDWRQEHWKYFSRVLPKLGESPSLEMLLVCERFRVVHRFQ
jgi:uncharacterized protein YhfF